MADLTDSQVGDTLDYLGQKQPLASQRLTTLPSTSAGGGAVAPPVTGGGGTLTGGAPTGGSLSPMGGGGGFGDLARRLLGSGADVAKFLSQFGGDLGTRGETGGVSLSDRLRDLEGGTTSPSSSFPFADPASQVSGGELALGAEEGLAAGAGAAGSAAAEAGLLEAFQAGGWEELVQSLGLSGNLSGLGATGAQYIIPVIESFFGMEDAFALPFSGTGAGSRRPSVAQEIRGQMRDLPEIMRQLEGGAVDPRTLRGMSDTDLAGLFSKARTAYGSESGLAPMFGESGRTEAGLKHLDMSGLSDPLHRMEMLDQFNVIAAQDLLDQRGHTWQTDTEGQDYDPGKHRFDFGNAIHALAGWQGKGVSDPLAAWDPYYKNASVVKETNWDPEGGGGTGAYADTMRPAKNPAEYLSAIGADPKLAESLGPLIEGAQPGQYLETLNKMFTMLNPDVANTPWGALFATQGEGAQGGTTVNPPGLTAPWQPLATGTEPPPVNPPGLTAPWQPLATGTRGPEGALGFSTDVLNA